MTENHIKQAINSNLSAVHVSQRHVNQIMSNITEGKKVKKKLSVGFVLLIVLVLAVATALAAITLNAFYEKAIQKEGESGVIQDWSAEDQATLVDWMLEAGIELDADKVAQLQVANLSEEEKSVLAMEIITDYYPARDGILTTMDIIAKEKGPIELWSLDDRAWWSAMMIQYQPAKIEYAMEILCKHFDDVEEILSAAPKEIFYGYYDAFIDEPIWVIEFVDPLYAPQAYRVKLSREGDLLSYSAPSSKPYEPGEDELSGANFVTPGHHDVTLEQALDIATFVMGEIGDYETRMDQLTTSAYFLYNDRFNQGLEPVWLIYFYQNDILQQKVLLGYDGSFIDTAAADKQFQNVSRKQEPYYPFKFSDVPFFEMSLEERAALSEKWIPAVNEAIEKYPYYPTGAGSDLLYAATRYVYGVPDESHITQDEATMIAKQAIIAIGANEKTINSRRIEYRFDITDETIPLWRVIFFTPRDVTDDLTRYRVVIDANTAEVIETLIVDADTPITDYRF